MSQIDNLPPLRDVIDRYQLRAKKNLGQNFLLDLNLTSKIARSAGDLTNCHVIEVGPGPGGLTRAILAQNPGHLTVIERDERCLDALNEISAQYPGKMTILSADALEVDYRAILNGAQNGKLIANLPYNIATPLLIGWLKTDPWPPWFQSMTLMFQREVAQRIVATPDDKAYGRLGVLAGWRCYANILFDIDPKAFTPPPKVTSSVVHLEPRKTLLPCDVGALERVTDIAFQQRRKMLRASFKSVFDNPVTDLEALGISPTERAENITIADFVTLANRLKQIR